MKSFFVICFSLFSLSCLAQEEDKELYLDSETEEKVTIPDHKNELGLDVTFSATSFNGTAGAGLKLGFLQSNKLIFGPSIRLQHSWYNYQGTKSSWNIYGAGVFAHFRVYNYLFAGAEFEYLSTPFKNGYFTVQRTWAPILLIGGGFSKTITPHFRLNAGVMYDIINSTNSPLRQGYFMKKSNGTYIPVVYRIAFFFTL